MLCLEWSKLTRLIFLIHLGLSIIFSDFHTFDLRSAPMVRPALGCVRNEICGDRTSDDSGFRLLYRNVPQNWHRKEFRSTFLIRNTDCMKLCQISYSHSIASDSLLDRSISPLQQLCQQMISELHSVIYSELYLGKLTPWSQTDRPQSSHWPSDAYWHKNGTRWLKCQLQSEKKNS